MNKKIVFFPSSYPFLSSNILSIKVTKFLKKHLSCSNIIVHIKIVNDNNIIKRKTMKK